MIPSFAHRMVAVAARIVLAIVEDLPAAVADIACLIAAAVSLWMLHRLIVRTAAWIGRHVAAHRERSAFEEIVEHFHDSPAGALGDEPTQQLPGPTRLGPTVPLPARELQRRTRRSIRRRLTRRHTTTSSDRRN